MSYRKNQNNMFANARPTPGEFAFMLLISGSILGLFTYSDIMIHDGYVLPTVSECHQENHTPFCENQRANLGCIEKNQMCLYNRYGEVIVTQVYGIAVIIVGIRLYIAFKAGRKITDTAIFTSLLYGFTALSLFMFGFEDYFYFIAKGDAIPEKLPWLNTAGLFTYTKQLGSDPANVEAGDLYVTLLIGGTILVSIWLIAMYGTRRNMRNSEKFIKKQLF